MKKYLSAIAVALFTVSVFMGCASQRSLTPQKPLPEQNEVPEQSGAAGNKTMLPTGGSSSETASSDVSAAYAKLTAYKTEDYLRQSIADFNALLAPTPDELEKLLSAQADVISHISKDDENYDFFITTMNISASELYCEHMGEAFSFYVAIAKQSRPCKELDEYGEVAYEFSCFADLQVTYTIETPELLTVAERDDTLRTFQEEMSNYLNSLSEDEIISGDIRMMLTEKANTLANSLSNEKIKLSPVEIVQIELFG